MSNLAQQFQELIDRGMVKPAEIAPIFVPFYPIEQIQLRTVYNIGEAMIRNSGVANAKLEPSSK
jgi:hypothetical protein